MKISHLCKSRRNFSKISSKNIWLVTKKSLPLHSQIRNDAYRANKQARLSDKKTDKRTIFDKNYIKLFVEKYKRQ